MKRYFTLWIIATLFHAAGCTAPVRSDALPPAMAPIAIDVTTFGAIGDGVTVNTVSIQQAIDACTAQGGGVVSVPAGKFVTGTIQLKDNVRLRLEPQAVLLGSTNVHDYRNVDPFKDGLGADMGSALVVAVDATNVGIEGAGAIDGQGKAVAAAQKPYKIRPFLVRWVRCTNGEVKDVTLLNSGAWGLHMFQCSDVSVSGVTIRSRGLANNDGIDIDSCQKVCITGCDIDTGDDAICLKATSTMACSDIVVRDCVLKTSCNAIKLGTESIGDFERVRVSNCQIRDTGMAGIALYSVDGAHLRDVQISVIDMDGITVPISIRLGARLKTFREGDRPKPPGTLGDVTISNVRAKRAKQIGMLINGIPDHRIQALTLENIEIELPGGGRAEDAKVELAENVAKYPEMLMFGRVMPAYGMYVRHVDGITFNNVKTTVLKPDPRPAAVLIDVHRMAPADFTP
ncbi:MAG: right-handed parallel beta-helix repeat-containing protein [Burkholderiales bacterium]|nr:right-handed parallel beta-helix repeat-containing protein [Phycisphaerae bacterium]